jgi:hypothetical protein
MLAVLKKENLDGDGGNGGGTKRSDFARGCENI